MTTRLAILGSTGSIGTQTLRVVEHLNALTPGSFEIVGLATGSNSDAMFEQARAHGVRHLAIASGDAPCPGGCSLERGPDGAETLVRRLAGAGELDLVVGAIVGIAGLPGVLAAVESGIDVALATKETLVAAGPLVIGACARTGARLLPIDSEHSALWQAIQGLPPTPGSDNPRPAPPLAAPPARVRRMILTASGGPFRETPLDRFASLTPAMALDHPTWDMGPRVTLDCATMMNKGFELMEACWLYAMPEDRVEILIQPGSHVHSLVEFEDRSILAHFGPADMRLPIQLALTWPDRPPAPVEPIDLTALGGVEFLDPCPDRYPCVELARRAMRAGGTAGAVLNAADEIVVEAFLAPENQDGSSLAFGRISEIVAGVLESHRPREIASLADVLGADAEGRDLARELLAR